MAGSLLWMRVPPVRVSPCSRRGLAPQSSIALGVVWGLVSQALAPAAQLAARISVGVWQGVNVSPRWCVC